MIQATLGLFCGNKISADVSEGVLRAKHESGSQNQYGGRGLNKLIRFT